MSELRTTLAAQIVDWLGREGFAVGDHVVETDLTRQFGVSRTPVRAALAILGRQGVLEARPRRGYFVRGLPRRGEAEAPLPVAAEEDVLYRRIADAHSSGCLGEEVTESDLRRLYACSRIVLTRVLTRMAEDGLVERKRGHGWTFMPSLDTPQACEESYRFRLAIEPAALLVPGYALEPEAIARCRRRHEALLARLDAFTASEWSEMNAEFHELVVGGSGNRFFLQGMRQQNRLRRLGESGGTISRERVIVSCREHLAILEAIESGDLTWASALLRRHLEGAGKGMRPPA